MKKYLLLFLVFPLLAMECENRTFQQVLTIDFNKTYNIDEPAPFDEGEVITRDEVLGMFEIPNDAIIKEVNIESVSAKVAVLNGNQASALNLSGGLQLGNTNPTLFTNYPIPLVGVDIPVFGLNSLIAGGVDGLKSKIENYLIGTDYSPFVLYVSGNSTPTGGQTVKAQINLIVTGSVIYEICEQVPTLLIEAGEKCDI